MQRPARRIALERLEIERLGHDALPGEGGVAVNQDGQRDRGIVDARAGRTVGLLCAGATLDDGVRGLQVARVGDDRHVDLAGRSDARSRRRQVVLHVSGTALRVDDERIDRPLAFELAQDRLIRTADGVHEGVEPTPVGHPDHDLVRAAGGRERDGLVEHRHQRFEALERELLLPQERTAEVLLEPFGLGQAAKERLSLVGVERLSKAPRFDRLAEPDALGVVGDVLDLVGDRTRIDGAEER